ncbi:MAG: hypothetical protein ACNS60_09555 [Candidatus Cyclobacteriaceae bacterium M2_1C_046]
MPNPEIDKLYQEYTNARFLDINKEQFIYLMHLLPGCLIVMSDGLLDREEWVTLKQLSKILGDEFASEDLGDKEKEENLMLIYKGEMRYLLKNREQWEDKFINALQDYLKLSASSRDFVKETMDLFASPEQKPKEEEKEAYISLMDRLQLKKKIW